jgi:hypothetical protein
MFVGRPRYALVRSFVEGFGAAKDDDVLQGFSNGLAISPSTARLTTSLGPVSCCMRSSLSVTE